MNSCRYSTYRQVLKKMEYDDLLMDKLYKMRMSGMAEAFENQLMNPNSGLESFETRFSEIINHEWSGRENKKFNRLLKQATLKYPAADLDSSLYDPERQLNTHVIELLAKGDWIDEPNNLLITGGAGAGKTHVACALCVTALGEDFYNFQSVIYIVPDHICNKLTSANTFRYMMADKTISYDIAQELKSYFENSSLTDSLVTYNITMRTIEVNDNSAIIFIMQTGLTYSAIILFVTCFTILALQQLSDSGKYKYRFRVLRNMGVEEPHIRKLILKQLAVWFGVPVILALILSGAFLVFLFVGFHMQIAVYIGVQRLVQQLLIVLAILDVLLISYFISTWVLFNKSASA